MGGMMDDAVVFDNLNKSQGGKKGAAVMLWAFEV